MKSSDSITAVRKAVNGVLNRGGLASVSSPGELFSRLALVVTDHEMFRELLLKQEPEKRHRLYEAMRAHLRFDAKPLSVYEMEGAQEAERKQLPTIGPGGELLPYEPPELESPEYIAEQAIIAEVVRSAKLRFELACSKCTKEAVYTPLAFEKSRVDVILRARREGWQFDPVTETEACPECAAKAKAN